MTTKSVPPPDTRTYRVQQQQQRTAKLKQLPVALVGLLVFFGFWIIGARFTIDGVLVIAREVLNLVGWGSIVPAQATPGLYLMLAPIPVLFSYVEWNSPPHSIHDCVMSQQAHIWMIIVLLDIGTTFAGLRTLGQDMSPFVQALMSNWMSLGAITMFLTFWPEWVMRASVGALRGILEKPT